MSSQTDKMNHLKVVEGIKCLQETFLIRSELYAVIAQDTKSKYDAYVAAGFTSEQAIELCRP